MPGSCRQGCPFSIPGIVYGSDLWRWIHIMLVQARFSYFHFRRGRDASSYVEPLTRCKWFMIGFSQVNNSIMVESVAE